MVHFIGFLTNDKSACFGICKYERSFTLHIYADDSTIADLATDPALKTLINQHRSTAEGRLSEQPAFTVS